MTATHAAHVVGRFLEALSVPALVGAISIAAACGGGSGGNSGGTGGSTPTAPSPGGTGATPATTITIGSNVSPRDLRVETGESIRFVNNSSRVREMKSDPHPTHGSCPPIDRGGALQPGASVVVGPFSLPGTCYYHDHNDPENGEMRGQIRIAVDSPGPGPIYVRP